MSNARVDYSELVIALQQNRDAEANELLRELLPRLKDYLEVTMNAEEREAEECVHQAFLQVYEQIKKDNIKNEKYIFSYLLKACRHEYIQYTKKQHRFDYVSDEDEGYLTKPAEQIQNLMDEERQRLLEECLDELTGENREFMEYFIDKPDATTKEASRDLNLSEANVRVRKSRLVGRMHNCFKWKSKE